MSAFISLVGALTWRWYYSGSLKAPASTTEVASTWGVSIMFLGALVVTFIVGQSLGGWAYLTYGSDKLDENQALLHSLPTWQNLLILIILSPLAEEAFYRATFYSYSRTRTNLPISIIITTFVFALAHGDITRAVTVIPLSILLCVVYEVTRRIWTVWSLHALFNAGSLLNPELFAPLMDLTSALAGLAVLAISFEYMNQTLQLNFKSIWPTTMRADTTLNEVSK